MSSLLVILGVLQIRVYNPVEVVSINCMVCGEQMRAGVILIPERSRRVAHAGVCVDSVKKAWNGDVIEREITSADIERYKGIHEGSAKTIKETYPTEVTRATSL